ncbi:MAG TPA: ABC transporter permease [Bryobacteraceae bacterium]|nr:ABC transporter permease [Bryobacteraceae bacterium]
MNSIWQELRYSIRVLAKGPGVTAVAVLALALGIGVNASSFTAVKTMVLKPWPFPDLDRVVTLWETIPKLRTELDTVAPANFLDWQRQSRSFERMAAYRGWDANLTGVDEPEQVQGSLVSPGFFSLLGIRPALGRTFLDEEAEPGRDAVVVVSHGFWQRRQASAPDAINRKLMLNGRSYTVIGVMPDEFDFPLRNEIWAPLAMNAAEKNERAARNLMVLGRLKPAVSLAQARAESETIARRLEQQYPGTNESRTISILRLREVTNNVADHFVLTLLGAAGFVLLLACANVANLQLARASARQKEIALRTALGANRYRIARQLLVESIVIALFAGVLGLVLADWNVGWTRNGFPAQVYRWMAGLRTMHIDSTIVAFTLAASLVAGTLCSLPAMVQLLRRGSADGLSGVLREGGRTSSSGSARSHLRSSLVVTEVALALVLLVGAGLMVKAFDRMLRFNLGFNLQNLLSMEVALPKLQYENNTQTAAFYRRVLDGLASLPDAKSAAALSYQGAATKLFMEGRPEPRPGEPLPGIRAVSENYFAAMGQPIVEGRAIGPQDGPESPRVVVISELVARHYWPGSSPIGRRIKLDSSQSEWFTVVGVAGNIHNWFTSEAYAHVYISFFQSPSRRASLRVRTAGDPLQLAHSAVFKIHDVDRNQPVFDVKSMEQMLMEETSGVRVSAETMSFYAIIALLLAATGIYAVISYSVARRTHEIGVRLALGATTGEILKMILWQSFRLAAIGLAIGVPVAFFLTRLMSSVLYDVVALDPMAFALFTVVLGSSALVAGYIPARRAMRVDPVVALHHE